jgi:hypothetical protein
LRNGFDLGWGIGYHNLIRPHIGLDSSRIRDVILEKSDHFESRSVLQWKNAGVRRSV